MPELEKKQIFNLESVLEAAELFSNDAKLDFSYPFLDNKIIVLESGHQPNFLPHAGLMKKMFLLDHLMKKCESKGKNSIAFFGFADYNMCTSKLLSLNKLPSFNKNGFEKIGFKIKGEDVWKRFDHINKPAPDDWKKEKEKISSHYIKYSKSPFIEKNLDLIMDNLEESYNAASNFPDMNAILMAKICKNIFNLNIFFFRYSDIQKRKIFLEEWKRIVPNIDDFNKIYNKSISNFGLDIPSCNPDSLPFWYHCQCGAKVNLTLNGGVAIGRCMLCFKNHIFSIENLEEKFKDMSPNAVARNMIFSEGLGTRIFISGSGGSLIYGKISDEISGNLGFNKPRTVAWSSRDYYMGPVHSAAIDQFKKICCFDKEIIGSENFDAIINDKKYSLKELLGKAQENRDKEQIKKYEGQYNNLISSIEIFRSIYKVIPSFIDVLISQGPEHVKKLWINALIDIDLKPLIKKDIVYENNNVINIYNNMENLYVRENIDTQPPHG